MYHIRFVASSQGKPILLRWSLVMDGPADGGPLRYFADLPDPRASNVRHRLPDLLVMALCAVLCGADGWDDLEDFARAKADWFATFLDLRHGVPSADTFRRVFSRL